MHGESYLRKKQKRPPWSESQVGIIFLWQENIGAASIVFANSDKVRSFFILKDFATLLQATTPSL